MSFSCINECFQTITDEDVLEAMKKISGLPVVNNDDIITGVISEKDFLSRMNKKKAPSFVQVLLQCLDTSGCIAIPFKTLKVREVMSSPPVTVKKDTTMLDVANTLDRFNINRVPVSDDNNRLVGIRFALTVTFQ